jgi:hypothetical protein
MNIKESIKNYFSKIPAFLSGMLVGIVLTGSFFLFKINEYILQIKEAIYPKITVIQRDNATSTNEEKTKTSTPFKKQKQSIQKDTNIESINDVTTSNNILEEKVISEKIIKIISLSSHSSDTLIAQIADVPIANEDKSIKIIFKKTPFNNKGYFYENNAIVVYGLEDIPYINIYEYKGELYMKYDKVLFHLPYTDQFQSFIKVNDDSILAKVNDEP